jgi:hypothetical protein
MVIRKVSYIIPLTPPLRSSPLTKGDTTARKILTKNASVRYSCRFVSPCDQGEYPQGVGLDKLIVLS